MSQAAGWQAFPTEEYLHHTANFRRAAEALIRAAKDRNVDGAALAYVQMTMTCVDCHKYVRQQRRAGLDRGEPGKEGLLAFIER
jgi:cytochrome c556